MLVMDVPDVVARLRLEGSDTTHYEVKRASGGLPENLAQTLSAFANTPGGGDIIFGLDEGRGFAPVGVYDLVQCQKAVVAVGRNALNPSITVTTEVVGFESIDLVIAHVNEVEPEFKPVTVKRTGKSYLRQYDGDYPLSSFEESMFIAQRSQPRFDDTPVAGATQNDLDSTAVADYLFERRAGTLALAGMTDEEVLRRTGIITSEGQPTLAGLLALGTYPQQFDPNLSIQCSALADQASSPGTRFRDSLLLGGSIPMMLDGALAWLKRVTPHAIVTTDAGDVIDRPTYPTVAVRELVANALIHRDLSPYARSTPVSLVLESDQLIITNPGGLLGLKVESLGHTPSHSRNTRLTEILQFVKTKNSRRVVERLGSGIPAAIAALTSQKMMPPQFHDLGIRFTARILARPATQPVKLMNGLSPNERKIAEILLAGPSSISELMKQTQFTRAQVRYAVASLDRQGLLVAPTENPRRRVLELAIQA